MNWVPRPTSVVLARARLGSTRRQVLPRRSCASSFDNKALDGGRQLFGLNALQLVLATSVTTTSLTLVQLGLKAMNVARGLTSPKLQQGYDAPVTEVHAIDGALNGLCVG